MHARIKCRDNVQSSGPCLLSPRDSDFSGFECQVDNGFVRIRAPLGEGFVVIVFVGMATQCLQVGLNGVRWFGPRVGVWPCGSPICSRENVF